MTTEQENRRWGLLPRLIFLLGCGFFFSALMTGDTLQYFWGGVIVAGSILLHLSRQKDWKKHWDELDRRRGRGGSDG
ncbi:MAG: hypothetical protein Fur0034_19870 [Desulfuromonadia bacterium]